jgi:O-antigen/teichoic acid export membrane protein
MSELSKAETLIPVSTATLPETSGAILRILGRNTFWLWIDLGALRIGTMLAGLFLIRYFGPANFGVYSTALASGWIANCVVDIGLTRYAARAVAASISESCPILALSFFTTLVSVVIEIAGLFLALHLGYWQVACFAAGFVLCNLEGTASLCSSILTADLRSRAILPGSVIGAGGLVILTCIVIWLHLSVLTMLVALCFKSLLVLCLRVWQLRPHLPVRDDYRWSVFRRVARDALPFFSYNLTQVGYGKIAILCFGLIAPKEQVGWFAAAFVLSDVIPQWSYASSGALLPVWTRLFEHGRIEELLTLRQRLLDILLFASIPVWISLALFAPEICGLLGSRYVPSAPVLRIVAYRSVLAVLDGFLGHGFLVSVNRLKERQAALFVSLVLLAVLSTLFAYFWGAEGVAIGLFVSDALLILQYLRISSRIGMRIEWPSMAPSLLAGAAMLACAFAIPQGMTPLLRFSIVLLAYLVVLSVLLRERLWDAGRTLQECIR